VDELLLAEGVHTGDHENAIWSTVVKSFSEKGLSQKTIIDHLWGKPFFDDQTDDQQSLLATS
jgi:hypothetical protein